MYLQWVKAIENPHQRGRIPPSPRSNRVEGTGSKQRSKHQSSKHKRAEEGAAQLDLETRGHCVDGRTWQTQTRIVQVNRFWLKHVEVWTPITSNSFKFKAIPGRPESSGKCCNHFRNPEIYSRHPFSSPLRGCCQNPLERPQGPPSCLASRCHAGWPVSQQASDDLAHVEGAEVVT